MSIARKIAHKAEAVKGASRRRQGGPPATGACAPRAAVTRPRATSSRPGPRPRTPSSTDPGRAEPSLTPAPRGSPAPRPGSPS